MRAAIENWLLGYWYGVNGSPCYLRMLVPLYRAAYKHQQSKGQSRLAARPSGLPLVVVGNVTAGGSGKTPLVIRLCEIAREMNLRPGIASTGYGRQSRETMLVHPGSDTGACGDEPVLLAMRTGVPVVVAGKRLDAVKKLNELDLDLIISDDGLQQADMVGDIEFCVVDGERGLGNGLLIPAGPLRESPARLSLVDHVVSNGEWASRPEGLEVAGMQLKASTVHSLDGSRSYSVEEFRNKHAGKNMHAVAGIGNPARFFKMLELLGLDAVSHGFSDHYAFSQKDFAAFSHASSIIMTEKDAVKCRSLDLSNAWYIPVDTVLPDELELSFANQLQNLVKKKS